MNQPIPRNGTEPLKVGDRVQIVPEWQDPGDEQYERFVIEAPRRLHPGPHPSGRPRPVFQPTEWIEADHLISSPPEN